MIAVLEAEYTNAISTVTCNGEITDKTRQLRLTGIQRLREIMEQYFREGIIEQPIVEIWQHKIPFVLNATSKTEMEAILTPSTPRYNCGTFIPASLYHSTAEEMILWSIASLKVPLIPEAATRYAQLFSEYFPDNHSTNDSDCEIIIEDIPG